MSIFGRLRRKPIYILPSANASMVSHYANGFRDGQAHGYAAGVTAARDAVAQVEGWIESFQSDKPCFDLVDDIAIRRSLALAAIDGLVTP